MPRQTSIDGFMAWRRHRGGFTAFLVSMALLFVAVVALLVVIGGIQQLIDDSSGFGIAMLAAAGSLVLAYVVKFERRS